MADPDSDGGVEGEEREDGQARAERALAHGRFHQAEGEAQPGLHALGAHQHRARSSLTRGSAWQFIGPATIKASGDAWQGSQTAMTSANVQSILVQNESGLQVTRVTVNTATPNTRYELTVDLVPLSVASGATPSGASIAQAIASAANAHGDLKGRVVAAARGSEVEFTSVHHGLPFEVGQLSTGLSSETIQEPVEDVLVGLRGGGIWRRVGETWLATGDPLAGYAIRALAQAPPVPPNKIGAIYAAAGDPSEDFSTTEIHGGGLWRSTTGGLRWTPVDGGLGASTLAARKIMSVACPRTDVVIVGTDDGLYMSVDAAHHFGAAPSFIDGKPIEVTVSGVTLIGATTPRAVLQLKVDTTTPTDRVYAAVVGVGLLEISISPTTALSFRVVWAESTSINLTFDQGSTSSDRDLFYLLAAASDTSLVGAGICVVHRTRGQQRWIRVPIAVTNAAQNIDELSAQNNNTLFARQLDYNLVVGVDPQDAGTLYVGAVNLLVSTNGGQTWTDVSTSKIHADQQTLLFDPPARRVGKPTRVYAGNDGGIYRSDDRGANWVSLNRGIGASLIYDLASDPNDPSQAVIGLQDCGTLARITGSGTEDLPWRRWGGGDGGSVAFGAPAGHALGLVTAGALIFTQDGGQTANYINPPSISNLGTSGSRPGLMLSAFYTLLASGPGKQVFVAAGRAKKSEVYSIGTISDVTAKSPTITQLVHLDSSYQISAMTYDGRDGGSLWVGTLNGDVVRMKATGAEPTSARPMEAKRPVTSIALDPRDTNTIVVAFGGYALVHPEFAPRSVWISKDGGKTWSDISGLDGQIETNLPDAPAYDAVWDGGPNPATLIVATDVGVYQCTDRAGRWALASPGIPPLPARALAYTGGTSPTLRVGTWGRGVWERTADEKRLVVLPPERDLIAAPGTTMETVFRVQNPSATDVVISKIDLLPTDAFSVAPGLALPFRVAAGSTAAIPIQYKPTSTGCHTALLCDPDRNLFTILGGLCVNLTARPRLALDPISTVGFGNQELHTTTRAVVTLRNTGEAPLIINGVDVPSDFEVEGLPATPTTIAVGAALPITVVFNAGHGRSDGSLVVRSNDPAGARSLPVLGIGPGYTVGEVIVRVLAVAVGVGLLIGATIATVEIVKEIKRKLEE